MDHRVEPGGDEPLSLAKLGRGRVAGMLCHAVIARSDSTADAIHTLD